MLADGAKHHPKAPGEEGDQEGKDGGND